MFVSGQTLRVYSIHCKNKKNISPETLFFQIINIFLFIIDFDKNTLLKKLLEMIFFRINVMPHTDILWIVKDIQKFPEYFLFCHTKDNMMISEYLHNSNRNIINESLKIFYIYFFCIIRKRFIKV